MTSLRRIRTNRANAQASTGPKTVQGKIRTSQNAHRHGLSLSVFADPARQHLIAGEGAIPEILELARRIAEAQIDLQRVRYARHQFLSNQLDDPYYDSRANVRVKMSLIGKFLRPNAPEISMTALTKFVTSTPQGPDKFALILSQEVKQLRVMDRYERRALSRRKFAIREFDAARKALA
jgi:hypothetical protein